MAWIQQDPFGNFHISFRFGGRKFKRSLKTSVPKQAQLKKLRLEETIALVEAGRIELPPNSDVPTFLLSEGKLETKHVVQLRTLDVLSEQFFKSIPTDGLEEGTIKMMQIHVRTLKRHLGSRFSVDSMKLSHLQGFINCRAGDTGVRGKPITASTIKKEVTTFRAIFTWAVQNELLAQSDFPSKGLRYPKIAETLPFQTFEAVQKQTAKLDPADAEFQDLWGTVFLSMEEVEELLDHVQKTNVYPFVYPCLSLQHTPEPDAARSCDHKWPISPLFERSLRRLVEYESTAKSRWSLAAGKQQSLKTKQNRRRTLTPCYDQKSRRRT